MTTDLKTYDLVYWISERYSIKLRREQGLPTPWTGDPIMAGVRWCNVHREDDAVTRWMRENWNYNGAHPVWWWVLGRMLNYIPTLSNLTSDKWWTPHFGPAEIATVLKHARSKGEKVFTSAYTISTCGKSMDKIDYVMGVVESVRKGEMDKDMGWPSLMSLQRCWHELCFVDGLGSFLAAQVVADLKNTPGHPLLTAPDWWTWAAPGPGSLRGLNWYFYGAPEGMVKPGNFMHHLQLCHDEVVPLLPDYIPRLCMQDFQNCMCEFSKYMKVKHLGGHVRNRYTPG